MTVTVYRALKRRRRPTATPRSVDWALVAGSVFFGALILLAVYGPLVAPHDLYFSRTLIDGKPAPFPPSADYPFGSDSSGRDRLSWLLIGARGTVIIAFSAAVLRVALGAGLGLVAGFRGGTAGEVVRRIALGVSSAPATVATLLAVIAFGLAPQAYVLAFGSIGWAEPFHQMRRYARAETARPYIESARSLGMTERRLLLRHLLPNIAPQLLTTAAFQVAAVLLLMAELGLLGVFVGGATVVDYDSRGNAVFAPQLANWASMLATTKPIASLYGDLASVLLPCSALLAAVVATNLFGDALASRAQRFDVFRLVTRRQVALVCLGAVVIAWTVNVWPNRLASELDYARGFNADEARNVAAEIAAYGPRASGSAQGEAAAGAIARRTRGVIVRGTDTTTELAGAALGIDGIELSPRDIEVLSLDESDVRGPLVLVDVVTLALRPPREAISGALVVLDQASAAQVSFFGGRLAALGAKGLIVLDSRETNYRHDAQVYDLPTVAMRPSVLTNALHHALPDLKQAVPHYAQLSADATMQIHTRQVTTTIADVIARWPARDADAPVVLVVAPYDTQPDAGSSWASASATGVLAAALTVLRAQPLDVSVVTAFTSGDDQRYAGLRLALSQLDRSERSRLLFIVVIGEQLSDSLTIETQLDQSLPGVSAKVAARLADATGSTLVPHPAGELLRAIQASGNTAGPIQFASQGSNVEPARSALERGGAAVLASLAYIPRHPDEFH